MGSAQGVLLRLENESLRPERALLKTFVERVCGM